MIAEITVEMIKMILYFINRRINYKLPERMIKRRGLIFITCGEF